MIFIQVYRTRVPPGAPLHWRLQLATRALLVPNLSSPPIHYYMGSTLDAIPASQLRVLPI
jgi:hypothetical protein